MRKPTFNWSSDVVYAGGGKKLPAPVEHGTIFVLDDGSLSVDPDDDFYGGTISGEEAEKLALAILERRKK